jgi:CelD/BcsL family acetyltransferase involved in cellulose biosynthesis
MNFALLNADATTGRASSLPRFCLGSGIVAHIEIVDRMEAAEAAWRQLATPNNYATAYQDYDFCALWLRHVGGPAGMTPFIVIGRDDEGSPLFLWPLVRRKVGSLTVATYFCGDHANFRTTLWRRDMPGSITAQDLHSILAQLSVGGVDALVLLNQPEQWNGVANPMRLVAAQTSPDETHGIALSGTGEQVIARHLSSESLRKLRRKERKLAELPGFRYVRAASDADVDRYITEFMKQKAARLSARGIRNAFGEPGVEPFVRAACKHGLAGGQPLIEIHALESDSEILALFSGIHDNRCFSTMFNSYTLSEQARWSPGFTLLLKMVDDCARRGFTSLNLGVGAAEYKSALCDIRGRQFDSFIGLTTRGRAYALYLRAAYGAKRLIKRNPAIRSVADRLRARLFARKS